MPAVRQPLTKRVFAKPAFAKRKADGQASAEPAPGSHPDSRQGAHRAVFTRAVFTKRRVIVGIVVLAVLIAAGVVWATKAASAGTDPRLGAAATGTIRQTVAATGTIAPAQQSNLNFGVSGQVTAV